MSRGSGAPRASVSRRAKKVSDRGGEQGILFRPHGQDTPQRHQGLLTLGGEEATDPSVPAQYRANCRWQIKYKCLSEVLEHNSCVRLETDRALSRSFALCKSGYCLAVRLSCSRCLLWEAARPVPVAATTAMGMARVADAGTATTPDQPLHTMLRPTTPDRSILIMHRAFMPEAGVMRREHMLDGEVWAGAAVGVVDKPSTRQHLQRSDDRGRC
jgi:hypothetical protein